ncbi:HTH domain-containing protein [Parasegetibacter sp. NRK P23]|uniref:HTH domain-containing protein n=1 Tax=Parasegetibacter sp. NRK P23 TaxID=2942999 RepID=UPI002043A96B|nr:HTH domain-containing protein [Parasegetibacter sp. NRK P23]MCM5527884.1 HTH domain-containing protein [Parasegetibacter sp. NRK P23]
MPKKFIDRFTRIDQLIARKATGTPQELAERLDISESTLYEYFAVMKDLGAPIKYDKIKCTYYYEINGRFKIKFFEENF